MKLYVCLLLVTLALATAKRYHTDDIKAHRDLFTQFKSDFSKEYHLEEDEHRFAVFEENLKMIDARNAAEAAGGGKATHGVTQFADWTQEEFMKLNGARVDEDMGGLLGGENNNNNDGTTAADASSIKNKKKAIHEDRRKLGAGSCQVPPTQSVNYIGRYTTAIKNQKQCGSCWAFTTAEQMESDFLLDHNVKVELSPTQLVQCDMLDGGCNGGGLYTAFTYVKATGGVSLDTDYPYDDTTASGSTGFCKASLVNGIVTITDYSTFNDNKQDTSAAHVDCVEKDMANYMFEHGPIALYVDASTWNTYTGGVMSTCGNSVNHAVQAVGLNTEASPPYWIVRNSWGESWGLNGYLRIEYGKNLCNMAYSPMVTVTAMANIADAF